MSKKPKRNTHASIAVVRCLPVVAVGMRQGFMKVILTITAFVDVVATCLMIIAMSFARMVK